MSYFVNKKSVYLRQFDTAYSGWDIFVKFASLVCVSVSKNSFGTAAKFGVETTSTTSD